MSEQSSRDERMANLLRHKKPALFAGKTADGTKYDAGDWIETTDASALEMKLAERIIDLEDRIVALEKLAHRHATEADVAAGLRGISNEIHHKNTEMDLGF